MVLDNEIPIFKCKADMVAELRRKEFQPFPEVSKSSTLNETKEGVDSTFDYLLRLADSRITKTKME
jgi:hypothetical protein